MSDTSPNLDDAEVVRRVEALLFAASGPLSIADLARRLPDGTDVAQAIENLKQQYEGRGVTLECVGDKWRFQTAPDLSFLMTEQREEPRRLSRAALETLSIIAYHQPCTRAEIESVRGVSLSRGTLDLLLEMDFVRMRGRRRSPGRPVTYGTTQGFLEHFGLGSLYDLPGVKEMKIAGLLDMAIPAGFDVPEPGRVGEETDESPMDADDHASEFAQDFISEDIESQGR